MKRTVIRGGQKILGTLSSGIGDPLLTRDTSTNELGTVPAIDPSTYLTTTLLSGKILVGSSLNLATPISVTGDVLISNIGVTSISPNVIKDANIFSGAAIQYSKLNLLNSIVNNDINASANISRSKVAASTAYRVVINDSTGRLSIANALTANRVLVSDPNGIPTDSTVTNTTLSYLDVSSSVQTQFNNRLSFSSSITPVEGDLIAFQSGVWDRLPKGTSGQYLTSTVGGLAWVTTPNGVPTGGTTDQYLRKNSNTDYDTTWDTLDITKITGITATAGQINALATGYYDATSSIQTQFSSKLANTLANNAIFVGNAVNQPSQLAPGSNGQVLSIVAGVPQWQTITGTGTVTSVAFSGGTTGLTVTGSPITTSGTIVLTGTLGIANGGTNLTTYTSGDLIYASAPNVLSPLGIGTNGYILKVVAGIPTWQANTPASPLTTKGDIYVYSTGDDRLPVGVDGYHLTADSTQPTGLNWVAPTFNPFSDLNPLIMDNSDNTKLARFEASGITTGTTRTYTLPDINGTIALLGATNGAALSRVDDTNVTLTLSAGSGTALLNATTITVGWSGTLADGRIASSANWNTAYDRSATSLGFTSSTFTLTKQDTSTLTVSVPTFNQNTTGSAGSVANALTVDNSSIQLSSGTTYDGSAAKTISVKALGITNSLIANTTIDLTAKVTGLLPYANFSNGGGLSVVGRSTNSSGVQADITGTANQVLRVNSGGTTLGFGSVNLASSSAVTGLLANVNGGTGLDTSASTGVAQVSSGTWSISTALANGTTATTQSTADNSTKVATTAYVDSIGGAWKLASGGTLSAANTITGTTSNTIQFVFNSLGTTLTNGAGLWLQNSTAALVGAQTQNSPIITLEGQGWSPASVATTNVKTAIYTQPIITGSAGAAFIVAGSRAGGAYSKMFEAGTTDVNNAVAYNRFNNLTYLFTGASGSALIISSSITPSTAIGSNSLNIGDQNLNAASSVVIGQSTNGGISSSTVGASTRSSFLGSFILPYAKVASTNNVFAGYNIGNGTAVTLTATRSVVLGTDNFSSVSNYPNTFTITGGSGYTAGTYNSVTLTGSGGAANMVANVTVSGGAVTAVTRVSGGGGVTVGTGSWTVSNTLIGGTGSGFSVVSASIFTGGVDITLVGYNAGASITYGSNNISIGSNSDIPNGDNSNQLSIQNIIYGTGNSGTGSTVSTGKIGIGVKAPNGTFQVNSTGAYPTLQLQGQGTGTNYLIRGFQSDGTTENFSVLDNGLVTHTTTVPTSTFTATYTATANNQSSYKFLGTLTSENVASDTWNGVEITQTLTRHASNPASTTANAVLINPTFSNSPATQNILNLSVAGVSYAAFAKGIGGGLGITGATNSVIDLFNSQGTGGYNELNYWVNGTNSSTTNATGLVTGFDPAGLAVSAFLIQANKRGSGTAYPIYIGHNNGGTINTGNTQSIIIATNGAVGIGQITPTAKLHIGGNSSAATWTTAGIQTAFDAATYTDTGAAGTRATGVAIGIARPTFAGTNAVTVTDAATVYIANDVAVGSNMTLTRTHALWVAAGISRFDGGIKGSTTNDSATAGNVGEYVSSLIASGSAVSLTTATAANITSISLTAGDWDVEGNINFTETTSTVTARSAGVTSTSATVPTDGSESYCGVQSTLTSETNTITLSRKRFSLSGTTTIYLVGSATFSAGTCAGFGTITARRVR